MSVQRYQDDVSGSNIASVTRAVKDALTPSVDEAFPVSARVVAVHAQTGRALVKDALAACRDVLANAEGEADAVLAGTDALRGQMEEARARAHLEVFGAGGDEIAGAVARARAGIKPTLDALVWYRLFWRVDDVREVVAAALDRAWCREIGRAHV